MNYFKYSLLLAFCFLCPDVFAGVFDVVPTDKSKQYLGIIFGGNVGAISLGGGANPLLSKMFERFNFIIVTAGVVVLSYIGVVSAVNTAREGEAMGKKFNLWVPLRGLFGMLLMIPTPGTGYSVIQMTVIWIVLNGVGAANAIWNIVLDQLALGIQSVGKIQINISNAQLEPLARAVLISQTCMNTINQMPQLDLTKKHGPARVFLTPSAISYAPNTSSPTTLSQSAIVSVGVANPNNTSEPDPQYGQICGYFYLKTSICKLPADSPPGSNAGACSDSFNQSSITQKLNIKAAALLAMFDAMSTASATVATTGYSAESPSPGYFQASYEAYRSGIAGLAGGVKAPIRQIGTASSNISAGGYSNLGQQATGTAAGLAGQLGDRMRSGAEGERGIAGGAETAAEAAGLYAAGAAGSVAAGAAIGGAYAAGAAAQPAVNVANRAVELWEQEPQVIEVTSKQVNDLKLNGWIHAGSYYYSLSKSSAQSPLGDELTNLPAGASAPSLPNITGIDLSNPGLRPTNDWTNVLYDQLATPANRIKLNNALTAAKDFYLRDGGFSAPESLPALGSGQASTGNEFMDRVVNGISAGFRQPILDFFQSELAGSGSIVKGSEDPLITIGRFGWTLMIAGEIAVFAAIAICFTLLLALAVGSCMSSMAWAANALFMQLFGMLFGLITLLWVAGATLGVYVPLVPYLIFTTSAIGWFMAVVEALVGGPIIALALTHPSGEEIGKMSHGIGILANIFLRPTLMIFGFVLAGGVLRAALTMINFGFMTAVNDSVLPSIFNIIPTVGIYAFLIVAVVNQAFSLIYVLPNKVLSFMGIQGEQFKPEGVQEAKEGFGKGAAIAEGGVKAMQTETMKGYGSAVNKIPHRKGGGDLPKGGG